MDNKRSLDIWKKLEQEKQRQPTLNAQTDKLYQEFKGMRSNSALRKNKNKTKKNTGEKESSAFFSHWEKRTVVP